LIRVLSKKTDPDEEELELIDSGAEDIEAYEDEGNKKYLIYTDPTATSQVSKNITQSGFEVESMQIMFKPTIETKINDRELAEKVLNFSEKLEDHDDIQSVSSNFDISDEVGKSL